jgi:phage-related protein
MDITQINLNGLDLISDDYFFNVLGLFDFVKDVITNDSYIDGETYNRSKIKSKTLVLNGFIKTFDTFKISKLNNIFYQNGLKQLVVTIADLGQVTMNVEVTNRAAASDGLASRKVSFTLTMPDPYLYSVNANVVSLGSVSNAALVLPVLLPFTLGGLTGGQGTITNQGNAVVYPIISIVGTCDTINITNTNTGESMNLAISLQDSDILVIDNTPSNRGIYLNGIPRMDLKNGNWITCIPGDNVFSFSRNSLQTKQQCSISLQSRWL